MSRSRRRSPVNTGSSAKWYKRQENRRYRSNVRQAIREGEEVLPHPKSCGDPWSSPKDGNMGWCETTWPGSLYDRKPWKLWGK